MTDSTVMARPAPATSMRRTAFTEHVLASLWFVPLLCAVTALVLSRLTIALDDWLELHGPPELLIPGDTSQLATTMGTVAAAMLTFLGVVFTTTLVAVQLASSQYSPRIVRLFVRSRLTVAALGVFLATFVYALNTLLALRGDDVRTTPAVSVTITYLLLLATVGMFIAFLHGMVHVLRVQHLLRLTSRSSHAAIDTTFPPADAYTPARAPETTLDTRDVLHDHRDHDRAVRSHRVLQAIDLGGLAALAARHDCWIEVLVPVGEHLGPRSPLARVHGTDPTAVADDAVIERFLFGDERTMLQDPGFGFRQLVDISSRALSPAVNDPTTAVAALNRVVDLLERIGDCPDPTGWYTDLDGTVRLRIVQPGFERLARLGLEEIVRYGADSPQVTRSLAAAYDDLERVVLPEREPVIAALREQFTTAVSGSMPQPFLAEATHPDRLGLG